MTETLDYKALLAGMPQAVAVLREEESRTGKEPELVCVAVNPAFEQVTGLPREKMVGSRISGFFRTDADLGRDWAETLRDIASGGPAVTFDYYHEPGSSWYEVTAFSGRPGYCTVIFSDVSARRANTVYLQSLLDLSAQARAAGDSPDYRRIADDLRQITGARLVMINIYDYPGGRAVTRGIAGLRRDLERAAAFLGFKVEGHTWPLNREIVERQSGGRFYGFPSLAASGLGGLATQTARALARLFRLGTVYVCLLSHLQGEPYGDALLFMPRGAAAKNRDLAEAYLVQLSEITARARAERELLEKSRELQGFFEVSLDLLCIADVQGNFLKVNQAWAEILGFEAAELESRQFLEFVHPGDLEATLATMSDLARGERVLNFINRYRCKDGSYRYIEWRSYPQGDLIYAAARDITERKVAADALQASNDRFNQLAEESGTIIWEVDAKGIYTYISPSVERVLGYRPDQIVGQMHFYDLHPPDGRETFKAEAFALIGARQVIRGLENLAQTRGGKLVWLSTTGYPLIDASDILIGYRGSDSDITERKQAEEALREGESRTRALVEALPDLLFSFNSQGDFIDARVKNPEMLFPAGREAFKQQSLLGMNIRDVVPPELATQVLEALARSLAGGGLQVLEYEVPENGAQRFFEARLSAGGSNEVIAIIRDVTERKQYEENLRYFSFHDALTGLYNRAYFENELQRFGEGRERPVTLVSLDLDGLKLVNDILGHKEGDAFLQACAGLLRNSLRAGDVIARIGGDEFAIILPGTDREVGSLLLKRIRDSVEIHNQSRSGLPLSLSMGLAVSDTGGLSPAEAYREADRVMYKDKLLRSSAGRRAIVRALLSSHYRQEGRKDDYNERVKGFCLALGRALKLGRRRLEALSLLAEVYDLGKAAVPTEIVNKQGKLDREEWEILTQHVDRGYRIAAAVPELAPIAEFILHHRENWDGSGYPFGLKGESILLEARILALADAYCAMTTRRPYAPNLTPHQALRELRQGRGRQFDPRLVDLFISQIGAGADSAEA